MKEIAHNWTFLLIDKVFDIIIGWIEQRQFAWREVHHNLLREWLAPCGASLPSYSVGLLILADATAPKPQPNQLASRQVNFLGNFPDHCPSLLPSPSNTLSVLFLPIPPSFPWDILFSLQIFSHSPSSLHPPTQFSLNSINLLLQSIRPQRVISPQTRPSPYKKKIKFDCQ